ncbi:MAG TPA: DNA methyltransferase, partial [Methylomirabilota bacterium]|nr:DNA methyltransferase [Methylomirabilota bacterium]
MTLDKARARQLLASGELSTLFVEALGWDRHTAKLQVPVADRVHELHAVAQKRGMVAWRSPSPPGEQLPNYSQRRKIEHQVSKSSHEHLIVFTDAANETQIWQWVKREPGKPAACREHTLHRSQPGDALLQKLDAIAFALEEEERLSLTDVTQRARAGFDVERVTKRFYDQFQKEHAAFLKLITGIAEAADREWYASVMLNRLMFVYFIQRKGFLDGDSKYLRNRLDRMRTEHGRDKFYSFYRYFLLRLFHEGLGGRERTPKLETLLGRIPYLNGGLFDLHELERPERYGKNIQIPDQAFERIFDYFDQYQWHLDERPLRADDEINPDVLGYIFEKYINQKQMGAYYTKEDITEYISKNTVLPFLFDAARAKCRVAFENPKGPTLWDLLTDDPDRYIYPAVRHGGSEPIPEEIAAGLNPPTLHQPVAEGLVQTLELRKGWNKAAPPKHALPTETWREVIARRARDKEVKARLAAREVRDIADLITLNLDIRQFAQDAIENCEGPELLRAFWHAIEKVTVLDPTCGSGAFLFAALNILEPLYEGCLTRMEAFVADLDRSGETRRPEKFSDFRKVLANVAAHPNRRYFIFKSIILNNLYGVDIMEEAVEICKLRLFLKLAAQVEPDTKRDNLGIEPLPDIDFNVKVGNTLVGFATYDDVNKAILGDTQGKMDLFNEMDKIAVKAADLQQAFDAFRERQVEGDASVPTEHKLELRNRLSGLQVELNRYLAIEYGVESADKTGYAKWLKSHQPFHWFVEFYGIMNGGGFDVILGNPPYVEYRRVRGTYRLSQGQYASEPADNLYAYCM